MKTRKILALAGGSAAAIVFSLPVQTTAFTTIGGTLSTSSTNYQRDLRVNNNTADAAANNNQTPDPNFPGALGATLAVWKGGHNWNSDVVGQNFDFDFQGETNSTNGNNGNTVSWEFSGTCSGGVLAYMVPPLTDGWTVRFCDNFTWSDGPGNPGGGQFDIEGVAAHELGHALGLGHSNINCGGSCSNDTTMCPAICGDNGVAQRTPATDDINGLNFLYGSIPGNKPTISSLSGSFNIGGTLVINGSNFANTVNVKFTAGTTQNNGTIPGVVFNVPSTNGGTQVSVVIPAAAQDGNVFIWQPGQNLLSDAQPIDIGSGGGGCQSPTNYGTGELGSNGLVGAMSSTGGLPQVGNNNFAVVASNLIPNQPGLLFTGTAQGNTSVFWGTLLVGGTVVRTSIVTNGAGTVNAPISITAGMVGTTNTFQAMVRDTGSGNPQHTDALSVTYCN